MSQEPKTPMTEMHNFIIDTQHSLFKEKKTPEILKLVLMLNELTKITQELISYEETYMRVIKMQGIEEGIQTAKKIFDNSLNKLDNGNLLVSCIN